MTLAMDAPRDPLVPRPVDLPTAVPLEPDADLAVLDRAKILAAPDAVADWPAWRAALRRWRDEARARTGYDGAAYRDPAFAWTPRCLCVALAWLWDELLYDHEERTFTPDRFLRDGERRFGGYDGIVLWHAYPVIGIDERNQFDLYRGVPGLPELVAHLQGRGVRVFLDYNPWDIGTRRSGIPDEQAVADVVAWLGADGVMLDTLREARPELRAAVDAARPGVAFEGESSVPCERIADHHLSWAQWVADSPVPGVLRARWFEQRHLLHHTRRWNRDHAEELRSAWLNGVGVLVWENVFGSWVGWSERDASLLRSMLRVQRRFADLLTDGDWEPLAARSAEASRPAVVGSRFAGSGRGPVDAGDQRRRAVSGRRAARRPAGRPPAVRPVRRPRAGRLGGGRGRARRARPGGAPGGSGRGGGRPARARARTRRATGPSLRARSCACRTPQAVGARRRPGSPRSSREP